MIPHWYFEWKTREAGLTRLGRTPKRKKAYPRKKKAYELTEFKQSRHDPLRGIDQVRSATKRDIGQRMVGASGRVVRSDRLQKLKDLLGFTWMSVEVSLFVEAGPCISVAVEERKRSGLVEGRGMRGISCPREGVGLS